jgi:hypothetical protein
MSGGDVETFLRDHDAESFQEPITLDKGAAACAR